MFGFGVGIIWMHRYKGYSCGLRLENKTIGRRIFVYLTKDSLSANGYWMDSNYQARIDIDEPLILKSDEQAEFILIDVPSCKGWGYSAETLRGQKK